jgi:ParB family chromosome partitioning protein
MPSTEKTKGSSQKKRLGRGLGSLLNANSESFDDAKKQQGANKTQSVPDQSAKNVNEPTIEPGLRIWNLAIEKISPNSSQPRKDFEKEALMELAQSIKEQGIIQPITVRKKGDRYEIIAGERRWRASQMAGLKEVPAIVKNIDDQKTMELALIENLQREDLNPVEEAMGYQHLIDDYNLTQQDLATKVGKSRASITNSLRILVLPQDIKKMMRQGLLSLGHAKVLLGLEDTKAQIKLARKTIQKKLSVRALEKEILKSNKSGTGEVSRKEDVSHRLSQSLAQDLQKKLGTKVQIQYNKGKGKIEIAFYSDDELNSLVERIKPASI